MKTIDSFEFLRACDREFTRGDGSIADWASNYYLLEAESYSESVINSFDTFELAMRSYEKWVNKNRKCGDLK